HMLTDGHERVLVRHALEASFAIQQDRAVVLQILTRTSVAAWWQGGFLFWRCVSENRRTGQQWCVKAALGDVSGTWRKNLPRIRLCGICKRFVGGKHGIEIMGNDASALDGTTFFRLIMIGGLRVGRLRPNHEL